MRLDNSRIDLAKYRIEKASERLRAAHTLSEASLWNDSINRSYYAIFFSARSLLALYGLDSKKHSGTISLFNRYFVKTGILSRRLSETNTNAKRGRESADYDDFVEFTKEEAEAQLRQAQEFMEAVKEIPDKIIRGKLILPALDI